MFFLFQVKRYTACLFYMGFNRQAGVWKAFILIKPLFYPPATNGSSWSFELSCINVFANFGLETSLPFKRTTEQKSVSSKDSKRDEMVIPSDHCILFSSTSIIYYTNCDANFIRHRFSLVLPKLPGSQFQDA